MVMLFLKVLKNFFKQPQSRGFLLIETGEKG